MQIGRVAIWISLILLVLGFSLPAVDAAQPDASLSAEKTTVFTQETVQLDASHSSDPDGDSLFFSWDFGDGNYDNNTFSQMVTHSYYDDGRYNVTLNISDGTDWDVSRLSIRVLNQLPLADLDADDVEVHVGERIRFDASESYDPDGYIIDYFFDFDDNITTGWVLRTHFNHSYDTPGIYNVTLRVMDDDLAIGHNLSLQINVTDKPSPKYFDINSDDFTISVFIFIGSVVFVGFIGTAVFRKYEIPDVLSLVFLGILIGPVLGLLETDLWIKLSALLGNLALMILLFDGGLNLPIQRVIKDAPMAALLGGLTFILTMFVVGYAAAYIFFDGDTNLGLLLGAVVSAISGAIVLPLVLSLKIRSATKTVLGIESTISDVLAIVATIAMIELMVGTTNGHGSGSAAQSTASRIFAEFAVGAAIAAIVGVIWIWVLKKIEGEKYNFMTTIAVLFTLFAVTQWVGGSGPLSALIFGLILSNGRGIGNILLIKDVKPVTEDMKQFQGEISFFVRSFFFVFMGLIVSKSLFSLDGIRIWILGMILVALIYFIRYITVFISTVKSTLKCDKKLLTVLIPRGLTSAVLATIPYQYGVLSSDDRTFTDTVFVVIIITVVITTVGLPWAKRRRGIIPECVEEGYEVPVQPPPTKEPPSSPDVDQVDIPPEKKRAARRTQRRRRVKKTNISPPQKQNVPAPQSPEPQPSPHVPETQGNPSPTPAQVKPAQKNPSSQREDNPSNIPTPVPHPEQKTNEGPVGIPPQDPSPAEARPQQVGSIYDDTLETSTPSQEASSKKDAPKIDDPDLDLSDLDN